MKVSDYNYAGKTDTEMLSDEIKQELIKKIDTKIKKEKCIAHFEILNVITKILNRTSKNSDNKDAMFDEACDYVYNYLDNKEITIRGIDGTLSGEIGNFYHIPKLGQKTIPEYDSVKQAEILKRADELKKQGLTNTPEYKKLKNDMIRNNIQLAGWCVWKYLSKENVKIFGFRNYDKSCMENSALLAISNAFDKFDYNLGYEFSTYATVSIFRNIEKDLYRENINSYTFLNMRKNIEYVKKQAEAEGLQVSEEEIANMLGYSYKRMKKFRECLNIDEAESYEVVSQYDKQKVEGTLSDGDNYFIENDEIYCDGIVVDDTSAIISRTEADFVEKFDIEELREAINNMLETLTDREARVIMHRFGLNGGTAETLEEVAKVFDVSRERIRQIERKALRKLKHPSRSNKVRDFLD